MHLFDDENSASIHLEKPH